jgi:hypothetical protein
MIYEILFGFLAIAVSGIRISDPLRVYPISTSSVNLANINVVDSPSVRVWATPSQVEQANLLKPDYTPWKNSTDGSSNYSCSGFLRYGDGSKYTASIISTISNATCSLNTVRNYLWSSSPIVSPPTCECRPAIPLILARQYQGTNLCFGAPSSANGWPMPGLINCTDPSLSVLQTNIFYHRQSGQIRQGGKCLTASPYSLSINGSNIWKPWAVKWLDCSNVFTTDLRQSWDAPDGVGEVLPDLNLTRRADSIINTPSGHRGRITLRDSGDIGQRCLDVTYSPISVPVLVQAVFLEAPLCDDSRVSLAEKAIWRFYQAGPVDQTVGNFKACSDASCSTCAVDGELRLNFGPSANQRTTKPISVPAGYAFNSVCSIEVLRGLAVPDTPNGKCFCQTHNSFNSSSVDVSSIISGYTDDLPTSARPSFPARNTTNLSAKK